MEINKELDYKHVYSEGTLGKSRVATVSAGADNGANNCIAASFPEPGRHSSTNQAISNLISRLGFVATDGDVDALGLSEPFIAGHGNEGYFETGSGQGDGDTPTQAVVTWNQANWQPEFDRLRGRNFAILTIISCHTGAGEDGADLLFAIARIIQRPVRARTGFTYCGNGEITFEANSTWQVATPQSRPQPIAAPTPHFGILEEEVKILIRTETGYVEIPLQSIQKVTVSRTGQFFPSLTAPRSLDSNNAVGLLRLVDFENPFNPGGVPAAIVTGNLTVTFADSEGNQETRGFIIYNDRLIQDTKFSDAFYYVGPTFKTFIQSL